MRSAEFTELELLERVAGRMREWFGPSSGVGVAVIDGSQPLFPEEEAHVQRAVPRRRDEFAAGRWCARQALAELGVAPAPIPVGAWRNPLWPRGMTGSISHTTGACAAVAAPCTTWKALGIDLLDRSGAESLPVDAHHLLAHARDGDVQSPALPSWAPPLALMFSAKESVIKALSPGLQRFVDFPEIRLQSGAGVFTAALDAADIRIEGWWTLVMDELILTGAVVV